MIEPILDLVLLIDALYYIFRVGAKMEISLKCSWINSQLRYVGYDILPVVSSHVETVCLLSRKDK